MEEEASRAGKFSTFLKPRQLRSNSDGLRKVIGITKIMKNETQLTRVNANFQIIGELNVN